MGPERGRRRERRWAEETWLLLLCLGGHTTQAPLTLHRLCFHKNMCAHTLAKSLTPAQLYVRRYASRGCCASTNTCWLQLRA